MYSRSKPSEITNQEGHEFLCSCMFLQHFFSRGRFETKLRHQHSTFNVQHSTFDIRQSTFDSQHSTINIHHSTFNIRHSVFTIRHSAFNTRSFNSQHSTFDNHSTINIRLCGGSAQGGSTQPRTDWLIVSLLVRLFACAFA